MKILRNKKRKIAIGILFIGIAFIIFYMGFYGVYNLGLVSKVKKITINTDSIGIKVGATYKLNASIYPSDVSSKKVIWTSSDESIAKVDSNGVVSGIKSGYAIITATSLTNKKVTDTVQVTVSNDDVNLETIICKKNDIFLQLGYSYLLEIGFAPSQSNNIDLRYTSSNEDVAVVDNNGFVKGITIGKSIITVKDEKTGVNTTCNVIVLNSGGELGNS